MGKIHNNDKHRDIHPIEPAQQKRLDEMHQQMNNGLYYSQQDQTYGRG